MVGSGFEPLKAKPADLQYVALPTELKAPSLLVFSLILDIQIFQSGDRIVSKNCNG